MELKEKLTEKELMERLSTIPDTINDGIDLTNILNRNNIIKDISKTNVYEDNVEVYELGTDEPYPYFLDNFVIFKLPELDDDGDLTMYVEFIDYGEDIDVIERQEVMEYLDDVLMFMGIYPLFIVRHSF